MGDIITVLGEVSKKDLGFTQCHEHLFIQKGRSFEINSALCIDDFQTSLKELVRYKNAGGDTIVDAQPVGCGRSASILKELSMNASVNIVASTGFHKMIFYPEDHWIFKYSSDRLANLYIKELTEGMFENCDKNEPFIQTRIRAGIIKTALDVQGIKNQYEKLFMAAVDASLETNTTIMVHIEKESDPLNLAKFLIEKKIPSENIIFCHLDRTIIDRNIHKELANLGIFLEYDTIGRYKYHSDLVEAHLIKEIIEAGFENNILMSLDTTRDRMLSYGGGIGLTYILENFIPELRKQDLDDKVIMKMLINNPARALGKKKV